MKPLTDNMQHALNVLAAHELMGSPWGEARHIVDGNALNALMRRDLIDTDRGLDYQETQYLTLEACAMVRDEDVFTAILKYRKAQEAKMENLQAQLETARSRFKRALNATVNSGHDVVEVEVDLAPLDPQDGTLRTRKSTVIVRSDVDDKSQAFTDRVVARTKDAVRGSYYWDRRVDYDGPAEVQVIARYTLGPVRS